MSTPIVPLTDAERAEIVECERQQGTLAQRIAEIHRQAAIRDGIAPEWLAAHA